MFFFFNTHVALQKLARSTIIVDRSLPVPNSTVPADTFERSASIDLLNLCLFSDVETRSACLANEGADTYGER